MNTMAGEFEGGVCGENWWVLSKNHFGSSPCSLPMMINDIGSYGGWNHDPPMDMKASSTTARSSDDHSAGSASDESVILQEFVDQTHQAPNSNQNDMASVETSFFPDTNTRQQWNQDHLLGCGKSDENYSHHLLQEVTTTLNSSMNYLHQTRSNNFSQDSSSSFSNQTDHRSLYSYNNSVSSLLQNLFDDDFETKPKEHILTTTTTETYSLPMIISPSELMPSLHKASTCSSMMKPPLATQQNHLQVTNNTRPYGMEETESSLRPLTKSLARSSSNNKANKASDGPTFKRARIETPSPLPTFKVRKEKLGDRVTALQQLVSPFGKTDTASVLFEAIEYIKFLHDQVNALSTSYMKSGSPPMHCQQGTERVRHQEGRGKDLESRGLCLVPLSSTFSIASETTADFWTPNFGGNFMR